jgi:hypothetical protein
MPRWHVNCRPNKMFRTFTILAFITLFASAQVSHAQNEQKQGFLVYTKVIEGDTLPHMNFKEVVILPPHEFENKKEMLKYAKLVRNIKKVLPYAKLAKTRLIVIQNHLLELKTDAERKEYLKIAEQELKDEFEEEITNLTMSQGRLLIKLIDRETGNTSYALIKDLKGSFSAFLYQGLARLFGENLKEEYDATGDDKLIEEIILRIENGEF